MTPGPGALSLPQLQGRPIVTDGGLETDLIFHHGGDLPHFAASRCWIPAAGGHCWRAGLPE